MLYSRTYAKHPPDQSIPLPTRVGGPRAGVVLGVRLVSYSLLVADARQSRRRSTTSAHPTATWRRRPRTTKPSGRPAERWEETGCSVGTGVFFGGLGALRRTVGVGRSIMRRDPAGRNGSRNSRWTLAMLLRDSKLNGLRSVLFKPFAPDPARAPWSTHPLLMFSAA